MEQPLTVGEFNHFLIHVRDLERSMAFYRDQLGFRSIAAYGDEYGIVERDGVEIHFWPCADRKISENTSAYFRTDDVDGLHDDVERLATEARITAPVTRPCGCGNSMSGIRTAIC